VPLEFTGEAPIEKSGEGILNKNLREVEIKTLPKNLPQQIVVDLGVLETLQDVIYAKDLVLPEGVELAIDPETSVVSSIVPQEEPEEEEVQEIDFDSIEASKEKGDEEEGEAPAKEEKEEE
jgi:large subunit ribosomal protein L25